MVRALSLMCSLVLFNFSCQCCSALTVPAFPKCVSAPSPQPTGLFPPSLFPPVVMFLMSVSNVCLEVWVKKISYFAQLYNSWMKEISFSFSLLPAKEKSPPKISDESEMIFDLRSMWFSNAFPFSMILWIPSSLGFYHTTIYGKLLPSAASIEWL